MSDLLKPNERPPTLVSEVTLRLNLAPALTGDDLKKIENLAEKRGGREKVLIEAIQVGLNILTGGGR